MNLTGVNQITAWGFYLRVGTEAQHELPDGRLQIELPPFQVYCALELRGA